MVAQLLENQTYNIETFKNEDKGTEDEVLSVNEEEKENDDQAPYVFQTPNMDLNLPGCSTDIFYFSQHIKEADPKVMPVPADLLEQGINCQKF